MTNLKTYLTTKQAADILGYSEQTLAQSRSSGVLGGGKAPPYIKRGKMVRYVRAELDAWMSGGIYGVYEYLKSQMPACAPDEYDKKIKEITDYLGI
jgi:predicted DNA-binding transcriptional regulator AlpA